MRPLVLSCACLALCVAVSNSQPEVERASFAFVGSPRLGSDEAPDDPGYAVYRNGYAKVLNEEWDAARKIFQELQKKYPGSRYVDDAQYWSAYSLMQTDRARAIDAYRAFIKNNPRSRYIDDAVVDLAELQPGALHVFVAPDRSRDAEAEKERQIALQAAFAKQERILKRQQEELRRYYLVAPKAIMKLPPPDTQALTPAVQLKIEALHALSNAPDDAAAFEKLRVIATDGQQPEPVREIALQSAARFRNPQVLPFLVTVARSDTNSDLQVLAVDLIGEHRIEKGERLSTLIDLFDAVPRQRAEQRRAIFYTIAGIGSDRAVEFLKNVAVSDDDYELRREAVFYLGGIGTERARSALFEILKED